jgi:Na+-driven multidrug efflux pump
MRGYLSARNKQKIFMRNNIVIQVANIILSIGLGLGMFGFPNLGVFGIGVATSCSYFIGTMLYVPILANVYRPLPSALRRVHPVSAPQLVRTAFVAGASLNLYALGWVVSFWIVGLGGQDNVAAYQIVAQLTLPAIYLANSFGATAINFASIANVKILGSAAIDDGLKVVRVSAIITLLYGVAATAVAPTVVDWLTNGTLAGPDYVTYVRLSVLILCIYTSGVVLVNTIQGFGKFSVAFAITVSSQWLIFLPLVWFSMSQLGIGLYGVFGAELAYRIAVCVLGFLVLSRLRRRFHN